MSDLFESSPAKQGDVIDGKYRVERLLGAGGMGVVLAARHLELGTQVAVKLMRVERMLDGELVARFLREARASSRLRGEHVVRVFDVGRMKGGAPYMVMELLHGDALSDVLDKSGPLPIPEAVGYVLQACEAVAEAHGVGIIHRDLKPQNLFLTRRVDGKPLVKVVDFGLAKSLTMGRELSLTKTSAMMGSPVYMSPEQMKGARDIDARTDVWSMGVCLFELLTHGHPFVADSAPELCAKVLYEPPRRPSSMRPEIPERLEQAILRCFEKNPAHRFADVSELAHALEHAMGGAVVAGSADRVDAVLRQSRPQVPSDFPAALGDPTQGVTSPPLAATREQPLAEPLPDTLIQTQTDAAYAPTGADRSRRQAVWVVLAALVVAAAAGGGALWRSQRGRATLAEGPAPSSPVGAAPPPSIEAEQARPASAPPTGAPSAFPPPATSVPEPLAQPVRKPALPGRVPAGAPRPHASPSPPAGPDAAVATPATTVF